MQSTQRKALFFPLCVLCDLCVRQFIYALRLISWQGYRSKVHGKRFTVKTQDTGNQTIVINSFSIIYNVRRVAMQIKSILITS